MSKCKSICKFIIPLLLILLAVNYRAEIISGTITLLQYLKNVKLKDVFIAFTLYLLSVYIFAERWKIVLNSLGYNLKTTQLFPVIFGAIPINNITPANRAGGEPLRMFWIKKEYGVKYPDAFISILFERSVEALPVLVMGAYVVYSIMPLIQNILPSVSNIAYLALIPSIFLCVAYILRHRIEKYMDGLKTYYYKLKKVFFPTLFLSSTVWLLDILRFKFITLSLGLHLPLKVIMLISLLYLILGSIPLTTGGLGVVETGLIVALNLFGISTVTAAGIVVIERFISYVLASLIGSVFLIQFGGLKLWKDSKSHS
ncbi:lysylphosphatidylglycerol synthase transmembrane domain-containing protein [uncultured Methanomethylovorans sp.]|uniref:lysylphosphatidylglycerol synthase transmembrane domain-containing protein n=1 Tax=uncultured Methanomethylovorans sp. TaxID=183759 RepID=UPI002AA81E4B|nr:lysylphosphatidylglycerol synthase transmembrane domain-containing protein [uncultured Methanomethylovorans sp.]